MGRALIDRQDAAHLLLGDALFVPHGGLQAGCGCDLFGLGHEGGRQHRASRFVDQVSDHPHSVDRGRPDRERRLGASASGHHGDTIENARIGTLESDIAIGRQSGALGDRSDAVERGFTVDGVFARHRDGDMLVRGDRAHVRSRCSAQHVGVDRRPFSQPDQHLDGGTLLAVEHQRLADRTVETGELGGCRHRLAEAGDLVGTDGPIDGGRGLGSGRCVTEGGHTHRL